MMKGGCEAMQQASCDHLIDYFNGELDELSRKKYEEHLEECGICRQELAELNSLTEDLPFASEAILPPSGMKDRVLENVFKQDNKMVGMDQKVAKNPKKNWLTPLLAASLLFSLIGNGYALFNNENHSSVVIEGTDKLFKAMSLTPSEKIDATATASMIKRDNAIALVIQANRLQPLEGTQAYQVWLLEDGKPYRAGTFVPNQEGIGAVSYTVNYPGKHNWDTVAITLEPTPDSEQPQGEIVLSSEL